LEPHAIQRWNERICTVVPPQQLLTLIRQVYFLGRIHISKAGWGVIDNEILFGYRLKGNRLIIQTFLGRISLIPHLANYPSVLRFNQLHKDRINLHIPSHVLHKQKPPPIPKEVIHFSGQNYHYKMEEYTYYDEGNTQNYLYYISIREKAAISPFSIRHFRIIDISNPFVSALTRKALYVLFKKGHIDFILKHILFNKPDRVAQLIASLSSKQGKEV